MNLIFALDELKYKIFSWRYRSGFLVKILLSFLLALFTGILAQIKISLPFTPVPITGQTLGVFFSAIFLGKWWGGISQAIYAILGFLGIPWFAGFKGGSAVLFGPTVGYIFGFIFSALFLGWCFDKYLKIRTSFLSMLAVLFFANFILIHVPGLVFLSLWFQRIKGEILPLDKVFALGTLPFIPGDIFKIFLAAFLAKSIAPKKSFNGEVDTKKS